VDEPAVAPVEGASRVRFWRRFERTPVLISLAIASPL
jgi:hypothetical protein